MLATFVGGAFADTIPTAPAKTTLQTTGIDIVLFNNVPPAMQIWNIHSQVSIPEVNFTTAFAFAPAVGFGRVTSVALTVIYTLSTYSGVPPTNAGVIIGINGQSSGSIALPAV